MATKKQGGSVKNLHDSQPKYLGTKLYAGQKARVGSIIIRQRGTKILAGENVGTGKDHTLFALKDGTVAFRTARKKHFNNKTITKRVVDVQ